MFDYPISRNANDFCKVLDNIKKEMVGGIEDSVTNAFLRTFKSMMQPSPVDYGNYVASHRMTVNAPSEDEFDGDFGGPRKSDARKQAGVKKSMDSVSNFKWRINNSSVWLVNNRDYAWYVELGSPKWRWTGPYLVYTHAISRMNRTYFPEELAKAYKK